MLSAATKKLRPYQVRLVTDVCRATGDVLVEQPTGSGKTVQIVTLVAMQIGRQFTHAVISAPLQQIEQGFVKRDYQQILFPECQGVAVPSISAPSGLIKGARESKLGAVKRVIRYLHQPGPLDHAFACTHAALNLLTPEELPENLSGKALFIDEAHHASADGLSQIVTLWRERGGQLLFFTATPYRGDGRPVRLDGMRGFRRSLAEHMAEGFAPRHLESEIVALGHPGDTITGGQFSGEEAPPSSYFDELIEAICRRWLEDGKPKAIVRVPPMRGGRSGELVCRLTQALSSRGAKVLDATGTGSLDMQRFLTALEAEKNRTHATSEFDVMVGIQRVLEGTDWPVCSAVYCVGMPGSLNTVVQFLGRAMRLKGEDYPEAQRDRARLAFFVPCGGGTALVDLSLDHSRHALLTCCFLADHEVGQEWIVLREVRRGIEVALGRPDQNNAAADAENEADEPLEPEIRAEVELALANAREVIIQSGGEPALGEVVKQVTKTRPDLPQEAIQRVATEILAGQAGATGSAVRKVIHREIAKRLRIDPIVKKAMAEAFGVVLDEFRDVTLRDSIVLERVGRQIHRVTGGQMREFCQRLQDAVPQPLTVELILSWVDAHYKRTGQWPKADSGDINDVPGETWKAIQMALVQGNRNLPPGSSLAKFLAEHRGVRNHMDLPDFSEEQILEWVDAYHKLTNKWPTHLSGVIENTSGETWSGVHHALLIGGRGLPGGSSLAKFLAKNGRRRNPQNLALLTEEQILSWADAHHDLTNQWPNVSSGPIACAPGETWANINARLEQGGRGLLGGLSLAQLLSKHRGVPNQSDLPPITEEQILQWVHAYVNRASEWPTRESQIIHEAPHEIWKAVDMALRKGLRGLPGASSLARFLAEKLGRRNPGNLPPLTVEWILKMAESHHERTGQWPNSTSGPILDAPGETWSGINSALQQGSRRLPIRSSLAQLLQDHFGVRNRKKLPDLTIEQILAWVDQHLERTGEWPNHLSGNIPDQPNETWSGINHVLLRGSRGLATSCSLADLLAQYRGVRNIKNPPKFTESQIFAWAVAYKKRTGNWPRVRSGPIFECPDETWRRIDNALVHGLRGLPGGSSLVRLIQEHLNPSIS